LENTFCWGEEDLRDVIECGDFGQKVEITPQLITAVFETLNDDDSLNAHVRGAMHDIVANLLEEKANET
jgi:hypothetical protein